MTFAVPGRRYRIRRAVAGMWGAVHLGVALSFWVQANSRTQSSVLYSQMISLGRNFSTVHPMWLFAGLFTLSGALILGGVIANSVEVAKAGLVIGFGVAAFYTISGMWAIEYGGSYSAIPLGLGILGAHLIAVWRLDHDWGM